jgi:SSS family solute:Na+ symporter
VLSFAVPPVVSVFLFGFFWKRGSNVAAKYTLVLGHVLCFICLLLVNSGVIKIHFTIIAGLLTMLCMFGFIMISLSSKVDSIKNLENLIWSRGDTILQPNLPWYNQAKYIGMVLMLVTLVIVAIYW